MKGSARLLASWAFRLSAALAATAPPALAQENLAQYEAEYAQLTAIFRNCQQQMAAFNQRQAIAAMNGYLLPPPPCIEQMQALTGRVAFLEMRIYRLRTGDNETPSETLVPNLLARPRGDSRGPASAGRSDPSGNFDRQAIRGNSLYVDENGEEHELPTRNYYFRDRASGAIIGSNSPDAPDNYHDYERFRPGD